MTISDAKVKFTKGPWSAHTRSRVDHHVTQHEDGRRLCSMYGSAPRDDRAVEESAANCRLAAASPDLFDIILTAAPILEAAGAADVLRRINDVIEKIAADVNRG